MCWIFGCDVKAILGGEVLTFIDVSEHTTSYT